MARFWDASAVIPLLVFEPTTTGLLTLLRDDEHMIVWWATPLECISALARRAREGGLDSSGESQARSALELFVNSWSEVQPSERVRSLAARLLAVHTLRAADALQLASALVWSDGTRGRHGFICLDNQLREASRKEGFAVHLTL